MRLLIISLFPEAFRNLFGLIETARQADVFSLEVMQLRDFGVGKHKKVDDPIFGGSDGMLLKPEVLSEAIKKAKSQKGFETAKVIALTPKGQVWTQAKAESWSQDHTPKILLCGRYAGFDQRFLDTMCDEEISIGDFVLNGGEVAALAIIESVVRLVPGAIGNQQSIVEDSFSCGVSRLEAPQYTRPSIWNGLPVPNVLLSGHHENVEEWKLAASIAETILKRRDLIKEEDLLTLSLLIKKPHVFDGLKSVYSDFDLNALNEILSLKSALDLLSEDGSENKYPKKGKRSGV